MAPINTQDDPRATQLRRCGKCNADAVTCYHVTIHRVNGLPAGRTYAHQCHACKRTFETISVWRTISDGTFAIFLAVIGVIGAPLMTYAAFADRFMGMSGGEWFGLAVIWALAIGGPWWVIAIVMKTYRLFENPVVPR